MTNFMFIIIVAIVLIALILFFTPFGKQLRVKFKGRTDEVMRQDAQTPEGARDYYNAAIREKEDFYNKAVSYRITCNNGNQRPLINP